MADLKGARILVTRPVHQAERLSQLITEQGGEAVNFPTLEIVGYEDDARIQTTLAHLEKFQWLVFISANAVNFALKANGGKIQQHASLRAVAIGPATAQALQTAGWVVDLMPQASSTEALLAMAELQDVVGQHFLIVRGDGGREDLAQHLRQRGAEVDYLTVYKRVMPPVANPQVLALIAANQLAMVTATSVESLQNLLELVGVERRQQLLAIPLVVISDRIKCIAVNMGFQWVAVTENPSDTAILATIITYVTGG